jgi:hypothetical protein
MKGDSTGIEIKINDVLKESLAGKANPVHSITPLKGDVCYDGDEDGVPSFSNKKNSTDPISTSNMALVCTYVRQMR